ncbi:hypothetical protein [Streptomyces sp. NPDC018347]|uniref:hypothetical protein n=1 Tax=Streptomyces sp. NPDC018347 TaxID=3157193 RepID=UPI0033DF7AF5
MGAQWVGIAVVGVVGVGWADRFGPPPDHADRSSAMRAAADLMPVLHRYHYLPIGLVRAVMFVVGGCTAPHLTSQQLVLDSLGGDEDPLSRAGAVLQAATRLATLVGPDVAGVLVPMMRASGVLFLDSASFVRPTVIVWRRLPTDAAVGAARRRPPGCARCPPTDCRGPGHWDSRRPVTTTHRPWPACCSPPSVAVRSCTPSRSTPRSGSLRPGAWRWPNVALGGTFAVLLAPLTLGQLIGCTDSSRSTAWPAGSPARRTSTPCGGTRARSVTVAQLAGHRIWMPGIVPGTEWAAYYDDLVAEFGLTIEATGPNFGSDALLDTVADTPALATFMGELTRLVWPAGFGLRRIPVTDPTPVYPHSLLWHRDNPHPALTTLRAHLTTTATGRDTTGTWTPDWASPR